MPPHLTLPHCRQACMVCLISSIGALLRNTSATLPGGAREP